jgi:hypothetical protein
MKQRGFYYDKIRDKKSPLTKERQDKLEAIGFAWVAPHVCKTKAKLPLRENIIQEQATRSANAAAVMAVAHHHHHLQQQYNEDDLKQEVEQQEQQQQQSDQQQHTMVGAEQQYHIPELQGTSHHDLTQHQYIHVPSPVATANAGIDSNAPHLQQPQQPHTHYHQQLGYQQIDQYTPTVVVDASTYPYVTDNDIMQQQQQQQQEQQHYHLQMPPNPYDPQQQQVQQQLHHDDPQQQQEQQYYPI